MRTLPGPTRFCPSWLWRDAYPAATTRCSHKTGNSSSSFRPSRPKFPPARAGRPLAGAIKYTVNSDLLFRPGGWKMSNQGKQVISKLAAKLAPTQENKLVVNGYTDNAPIGPALQRQGVTSNQILSQKRADDRMQFLISQGVKPDLVSARGFGDADPVASNDTAKGRAQNRRVEIALGGPAGSTGSAIQ